MTTNWGKKKITRENVLEFLKRHDHDQNLLHLPLAGFGGLSADDYAYENGWAAVLDIFMGVFR